MFHSSVITLQCLLIGLGVLFQFMAFSAKRDEKPIYSHGPRHADHEDSGDEKSDLSRAVPLSTRRSPKPHRRERDYYEMEKTEPGVRPGELLRTAKVAYFNDVNVKPTKQP